LWRLWSPEWSFGDATYARTAASFSNPDFVEAVIHSYRHRYALVPGVGHNPPQEAPQAFAAAIRALL
jgi:pimeloyl-ACP methyl ester carboxylesterase